MGAQFYGTPVFFGQPIMQALNWLEFQPIVTLTWLDILLIIGKVSKTATCDYYLERTLMLHNCVKHANVAFTHIAQPVVAIVAEGGGQRGIFTVGVLDAF